MTRMMLESGITSIGRIPIDWALVRLKDYANVVMGQSPEADAITDQDEGYGIPFLQGCSEFGLAHPLTEKRCTSPKKVSRAEGTLFSVRAPVGETNQADQPYAIGRGLCSIEGFKSVVPRFIFWVASSVTKAEMAQHITGSTFEAVSISDVRSSFAPYPLIAEQTRIATWLDLQTERIDKRRELLAKKRELLQDLKKSVVQEVTFRGVASDVEMRDSEIAWLGRVPSHWTTVRIGSLFREAADDGVDGLPMLSVSIHSGISDKELDELEMERKVSRSEDITLYKRVKPGDLVYNQMRAWQGAFGAAKIEGLVSPAYVVARPGPSVLPSFVEYLLRAPAAMEEIRRRSRGITEFRLRLYWNEFKNIRIALPPLKEQVEVTAFLDRKLSQIAHQITLIDQLDDLLRQQRKAIIHEAVTGKIDLSGYQPGAT